MGTEKFRDASLPTEQRVADLVPQRVVEHLEAIDVRDHHGHQPVLTLAARHLLSELVHEGLSVGEPGQGVEVGVSLQRVRDRALPGDVLAGRHEAQQLSVAVKHGRG